MANSKELVDMNKYSAIVVSALLVANFPENVSGSIDTYDSIVVRELLDEAGWNGVPVDSVVGQSPAVSLERASRVTNLDLSYTENRPHAIEELPESIGRLPELVSLSLRGNTSIELPRALSTLHNLIRLDCSETGLTSMPEAIRGLSLKILYLDRNRMTGIPDWIDTLVNLQVASFVGNLLTSVSSRIAADTNLVSLDLDSNRIESLPVEITGMPRLTVSVRDNSICSVDSAMAGWLDAHSLTPEWRTTQRCISSVTEVITEPVTGTIVHIASNESAVTMECAPAQVRAQEIAALAPVRGQTIVKAVEVILGRCFIAGEDYFLITFSLDGTPEPAEVRETFSIYHVQDGSARFLEGDVDTARKTISVRATREGIYFLTSASTSSFTPRAQVKPVAASPVNATLRNGSLELSFFLRHPSAVQVRLLRPDGRVLSLRTVSSDKGESRLRFDGAAAFAVGMLLVEIRSSEFRELRMLGKM